MKFQIIPVIEGFDDQSIASVLKEFDAPPDSLDGATLLYASYFRENYEGSAFVLFIKDGELWEVNGNHCSCYGLEQQWNPEETSPAALAMRFGGPPKRDSDSSYNHIQHYLKTILFV